MATHVHNIFMHEKYCVLIQMSPEFVSMGHISNMPALVVQAMAERPRWD